jgi:transposase
MQRLHSFETRLECIRLFEEENLTPGKIAKKMGIVHSLVERWLDIYKYNGIEGLKIKTRSPRYDENLKSKIIDQVLVQKIPYTRVASIYNLSSSTVQRWVIQSSERPKMNGKKKLITTEEAAAIRKKFKHIKDPEIRQIMEKNYWLELENEALKKFQALTQDQQEKK